MNGSGLGISGMSPDGVCYLLPSSAGTVCCSQALPPPVSWSANMAGLVLPEVSSLDEQPPSETEEESLRQDESECLFR
ncbi:unnamed protein product [Allacma fusca]|uniref:Uncharacterized protein n=1 Tax=Allacma fusca TaxID=39272 RepID=A0A8J2KQ89_9HEXA|nr:unnamed protein product [Allacma fusca]